MNQKKKITTLTAIFVIFLLLLQLFYSQQNILKCVIIFIFIYTTHSWEPGGNISFILVFAVVLPSLAVKLSSLQPTTVIFSSVPTCVE